jgi:hypothetical protein
MFTRKRFGGAVAAAALGFAALIAGAPAQAAPLAQATTPAQSSDVVKVGRGFGIYIGPGYGYRDYGYGGYGGGYGYRNYRSYYDDYGYGYYPRRGYRARYYDGGRYHNRRWARERFHHPLGRR